MFALTFRRTIKFINVIDPSTREARQNGCDSKWDGDVGTWDARTWGSGSRGRKDVGTWDVGRGDAGTRGRLDSGTRGRSGTRGHDKQNSTFLGLNL